MRSLTPLAVLAAIAVAAAPAARATGMLVPEGHALPPLSVKHHRVETTIRDQAASTRVVQVFQNNVDQVLEATYLFPLPKGASIRDFSMLINGKRVTGELLEREKARGIYESIVRRLKDPGLLEYADSDLIRARVYPIPARGEQQIELTYSQQLGFDAGVVRYLYPLKTGGGTLRTLDDLTFRVTIETSGPLKGVMSPTHKVEVVRKDDHHAAVSFEERRGSLNDDFVLYYTVSSSDIAVSTLTHDPGTGDGYFMMMVVPKVEMGKGQVLPKDVTFVMDTSGSMAADDKMRQAQNALKMCLRDLNPGDRFNVVRYSTEGEAFRPSLVAADPAAVKEALAFVDGFRSRGGTNIDEGLRLALRERGDARRPHIVLFFTDGLPTVGETDIGRLLDIARRGRGADTRIFAFGVGYDVNTKLLDTLSAENRGVTRYVRPEEDIEVSVGSLWTRISEPVMSRPEIVLEGVKVYDLYPKQLPDLFASDQVVVYGRYAGGGPVAIRLRGDIGGQRKELLFESSFARGVRGRDESDFIPALWATRKVGYLLEEIRMRGENPELKDEVIRLSREFGIMTPYTSFLVLPEEEAQGQPIARPTDLSPRPQPSGDPAWSQARENERRRGLGYAGDKDEAGKAMSAPGPAATAPAAPAAEPMRLEQSEGRAAVETSKKLDEMKSGVPGSGGAGARRVGSKSFVLQGTVWVETTYDGKAKTFNVKYGSEAYFRLVALEPDLAKPLALGQEVIVSHKGVWVRIGKTGRDTIMDDELRTVFSRGK